MKRLYVLAVIAAVFALCEVKQIYKECPLASDQWETIHIPHETNPHWFYKCLLGQKYLMKCPNNRDPPFQLCYNTELELCDWPWNVTACMGGGDTTPTTPTTPTPTTPTTPTPTTPTPTTPTTPTPTTPTTPTPTTPTTPTPTTPTTPTPTTPTTPTPTTPTTPTPTTPTTPTPTTPTTPTPTTPTTPGNNPWNPWNCPAKGRLPHETNCKMYYHYDYGKEPVCCLQNQVFNPKFCVCDLPTNVPNCKPTPADYEACSH